MGLSAPVPPEIINNILDEIFDDPTSLKICSLVARSFYEPTRRNLFTNITLDRSGAPSSLGQILTLNPKLSEYIRSMEIPALEEPTIREIVPVLPALSYIRCLILGGRFPSDATRSFSLRMLELLSLILRLPRLDTLEITLIRGFPINLLYIPRGLKYLILHNVILSLTPPEPTTQPMLELISLRLDRVWSWEAWGGVSGLNAPNLRQVVVAHPKSDVWEIIRAGAESIETVVWDDYVHGRVYPVIKLGQLGHLRHLCIVLSGGHEDQNRTYDPIHTLLHTATVAERLEVFTFIISKSQDIPDSAPVLGFLVLGGIWSSLADRSQFPMLAKVAIHLVDDGFNGPAPTTEEFRSIVSQRLGPLAEAGLLHATVCKRLNWNEFL